MIASISSSEAVAIAVTAASVIVLIALLTAARSLLRSARELDELADELGRHAATVLGEVEELAAAARSDLERVDDLVGSAEAISDTVASASRLAHAALSGPLIKVMALRAGTARAGRRLRKAG